ncbi:MAG: uracil-DNA glycosylase [Patescibacteria group bacterium]
MDLDESRISTDEKNDKTITELGKVREEVLVCTKCPLSKSRITAVPGEGSSSAEIMFIGEAPGATEDQKGIPFCGQAGKFLDEMLGVIGLSRGDIFITNTVKCRPPGNRDPEDAEKSACRPYLERQFKALNPKLIVCLGRHSTATYLPGAGGISKLHGKALKRPDGRVYLPLYHPAAALHNGALRETLITDFKKIPIIIKKIKEKDASDSNKREFEQQKLI